MEIPDNLKKLQKQVHFPEKDQTKEDFIKEELSKSETSFEDWSKLFPYYIINDPNLLENIKSWKEYDSFASAAKSLQNEKAKEVTINEESNKEEAKEEEKDTSPEQQKRKEEVIEVSKDPDLIPVPIKISPPEDLDSARASSLAPFTWVPDQRITNKESSYYKFYVSGEPKDQKNSLQIETKTIGMFSTIREFILKKIMLVDKLFSKLAIIANQPEKQYHENGYVDMTDWSAVGFDLTKIIKMLPANEADALYKKIQLQTKVSDDGIIKKKFFSYTDNLSLQFEDIANEYFNLSSAIDETEDKIQLFRGFISRYIAGNHRTIIDYPENYLNGFMVWFQDIPSINNLNHFIKYSPLTRDYVLTTLREGVIKRVVINNVDTIKEFVSIMQTLTVRLSAASTKNGVAAKILAVDNEHMIRSLIYGCVANSYCKLKFVTPAIDVYDLVSLLDCFCCALIVPRRLLDAQTVRNIHNYVFFNLVNRLAGAEMYFVSTDVYREEIDYLEVYIDNIEDRKLRRLMYSFFLGTTTYGGFAEGDQLATMPVDDKYVNIMGRKDFMFYPVGSELTADSESYQQLNRFAELVHHLETRHFKRKFKDDNAKSLLEMLKYISTKRAMIVNLMYGVQEMIKVISVSPFCSFMSANQYLLTAEEILKPSPEVQDSTIFIPSAYFTSAVMSAVIPEDKVKNLYRMEMDDIKQNLNMRGYFDEVIQNYHYAKRVLDVTREPLYQQRDLKMFTTVDRLDLAFGLSMEYKAPPGFHQEFKKEFLVRKRYGMQIPETIVNGKMIMAKKKIEDLVEANSILFGYVRHAIHSETFNQIVDSQQIKRFVMLDVYNETKKIHYYFTKDFAPRFLTLNLNSIMQLASSNQLNSTIQKALDVKTPIIFELPFPVVFEKFFDDPQVKDELPLEIYHNNTVFKMKPLKIYYDEVPEYTYIRFRKIAKRNYPKNLIKYTKNIPFDLGNDVYSILNQSFRYRTRYNKNLIVVDREMEKKLFSLVFQDY